MALCILRRWTMRRFLLPNSLVPAHFVLTAHFELELLRPVVSGALIARGQVTGEDERRFMQRVNFLTRRTTSSLLVRDSLRVARFP